MTNQVLEGFDTYDAGTISTTTNVVSGSPWQVSNFAGTSGGLSVTTSNPANGTRALFFSGFAIGLSQPVSDDPIYCWGFRMRVGTFNASGQIYGGGIIGNTSSLYMSVDSTGHPVLRRGSTTLYTAPDAVASGTYQYFDAVYNRTAGTCDVYLNGTLLTTVAGIVSIGTITTARVGNITLSAASSHLQVYMDDIYFNSGNERYGEIGVILLAPDGDDVGNQWTVNGVANGYEALDNVPPSGTAYIEGGNVGDVSVFDIPETPVGTFQIFTVVNRFRAQKTDAGAGEMEGFLEVGGVTYPGANRVLVQTTYTSYDDRYDLNPNTGVPWVPADFIGNNTRMGFERTA